MQTFAGPLGVFDHSPRLCTASDRDNLSRFGTLASSRQSIDEVVFLSLSIISSFPL